MGGYRTAGEPPHRADAVRKASQDGHGMVIGRSSGSVPGPA